MVVNSTTTGFTIRMETTFSNQTFLNQYCARCSWLRINTNPPVSDHTKMAAIPLCLYGDNTIECMNKAVNYVSSNYTNMKNEILYKASGSMINYYLNQISN